MNHIKKDILTVEEGFIVHQTNCIGVAGGLAGAIFKKWPKAGQNYRNECDNDGKYWLGRCYTEQLTDKLTLVNLFGQYNTSHKGRATQYTAFGSALTQLKYIIEDIEESDGVKINVYFPYLIGCGLGGGDWNIISQMIEELFPNAYICELP